MENKKGFTLVELLAVIAILAILVIIALPNVINMYTTAKKNTFVTEVQNLAKSAGSKYIQESMIGNSIRKISNSTNSLDTTGKKLEYIFELDARGNVVNTIVSDGTYCISTTKKYTELSASDIKEDCSYESLHNLVGTLSKNYYETAFGADAEKSVVNSITFYSDGRKLESNATNGKPVDVSEEKNGSVLLYANYVNDSSSVMDLYIVANGKIMFPEDSSHLLAFYAQVRCDSYSQITSINLNNAVDTSKVKNMSYMFAQAAPIAVYCRSHRYGCGYSTNSINDLDLSSFDTSNVTDMSYMFMGNQSANLNLSSFNTSKVTDMSYMFWGASAVNNLSLNNFNTSNVTNMYSMFDYTIGLNKLDISSFNTSNVTSMSYMFSSCAADVLDLSSFTLKDNNVGITGMFISIKATTGYTKDDNIASMFNDNSKTNIPNSIFKVK